MPTNCKPENLGEMIKKLVTNTKFRRESGLKMKKFLKIIVMGQISSELY